MHPGLKRVFAGAACLFAAFACGGSKTPTGPESPGSQQLGSPTLQSPTGDAQLDTLRPALTARAGGTSGGSRTYEFQISDRSDFSASSAPASGFTVAISTANVAEGSGGTATFTPDQDLQPATRLYWRARLKEGDRVSDWSSAATFRTKVEGFNQAGELYDPLVGSAALGTRSGSTSDAGSQGLRVQTANSWVRYRLDSTLTSGVISVQVTGLRPCGSGAKARIFSMMDGSSALYFSDYLFNVQYRGCPGNPDNAISYKVLMGDDDLKYEPTRSQRSAGVRSLDPAATYFWTASWGSTFRLTVREDGPGGRVIYDRSQSTGGFYAPSPHMVYLGANDAAYESGSYGGAIYRNLWVGSGPRPSSLGSALEPLR